MVSTPVQLVEDYLRSLRILREFSHEDETIESIMLFLRLLSALLWRIRLGLRIFLL